MHTPPGGAPLSVADTIVDAGYARALPEPAARGCMTSLLAHESGARRAGLGIWADPAYAVLPAENRSAFSARHGETILVEGAVTGTGEAGSRLYINFGPIRTVDFAVTIRKASLKLMESAGFQIKQLEGRRLRVRGLLDTKFGPQIEISEPSAIEFVEAAAASPYSRPQAQR